MPDHTLDIFAALFRVLPTLQDVVYKHLDRRTRVKRELADQLAKQLAAIGRLFKKSSTLIEAGKGREVGVVCAELHTEMELLGSGVMTRVLGKKSAQGFLRTAHRAAKIEDAAAELIPLKPAEMTPHLKVLDEAAGMFRALANEAKRRGTRSR